MATTVRMRNFSDLLKSMQQGNSRGSVDLSPEEALRIFEKDEVYKVVEGFNVNIGWLHDPQGNLEKVSVYVR